MNPILYSMMAKEWRKNLSEMLRRLFGGSVTMLTLKVGLKFKKSGEFCPETAIIGRLKTLKKWRLKTLEK